MPSCRRQSCARKKYPANCSTLDLGLFLDAKNGSSSFSFSCLDERKGGKRKSRHQGCLPSLPDTLKETKRGRGVCPGTSNELERLVPSCRRQSCARKKYPADFSALGRGPFLDARNGGKRKSRHQGCLPSWPGTLNVIKGRLPSWPGTSNETKRLMLSCMYPVKIRWRPKPP